MLRCDLDLDTDQTEDLIWSNANAINYTRAFVFVRLAVVIALPTETQVFSREYMLTNETSESTRLQQMTQLVLKVILTY